MKRRAPKSYEERVAALKQRAATMCERAVGKTLRVRIRKDAVVEGVVKEAALNRLQRRGLSTYAVFEVYLECGVSKARRQFFVTQLPQ